MEFLNEIREQHRALKPADRDYRNLGLIFLAALGILAGLAWWKGSGAWPWFLGAGLACGLLGLVWPRVLKPVYSAWMLLALTLGFFVSRLLLAAVFYLMVTPIGLIMRLLGKDLLDLKMRDRDSYWRERPKGAYDPVSTEKMY